MKLTVIVPVYNECNTVSWILNQVLAQKNIYQVIVVDDGSTDGTYQIIRRFRSPKLIFLKHRSNLGKGRAIRSALPLVQGDFVIIQDADMEYNPSEIFKLIIHAKKNRPVYGSRVLIPNRRAYFVTYLGSVTLTHLCNLLFKTKLSDICTCYKLLPIELMRQLELSASGFEIDAEITAKLATKSIFIKEVPIKYFPRRYDQGKKIGLRDWLKEVIMLFKIKITSQIRTGHVYTF